MDELKHMRKIRNWCAHPVYGSDEKLINPTQEQLRHAIRFCVETIFQRDAFLLRKILNDLLGFSWLFYQRTGTEGLKTYLHDKFYKRMNQAVKDKIFESLWMLAFVKSDSICDERRRCTYHVLMYLVDENPTHYCKMISGVQKFSNVPIYANEIGFKKNAVSDATKGTGLK